MATEQQIIEHYRRQVPGSGPDWLRRMREVAFARFAALGFPTARQEAWRFTRVEPIAERPFDAAPVPRAGAIDMGRLQARSRETGTASRLVFVDGQLVRGLSALEPMPPGVVVDSLAAAIDRDPARVQAQLGRHAAAQDRPFTALNVALHRDGAYVHVPRGARVGVPIDLVFISTGGATIGRLEPIARHPRSLILVDEGAEARVVERYLSLEPGVSFTNAVTEVVVGDGGAIEHVRIQDEAAEAFHIGTLAVREGRDSRFTSSVVSVGAALSRLELEVGLEAEGAEAVLNGLYVAGGRQRVDHQTSITHARPRCTSRELYKGILGDEAHGVFNGRILVSPGAARTDARQTNRNLLLTDGATINTQPQLEIYADDVKCAHGATIGHLDAEAMFYLRSRGIDAEAARDILCLAFAREMIEPIGIEPLRAALEASVRARLGSRGETEEG
jgi:Fe-S cluster assembly protein SufD